MRLRLCKQARQRERERVLAFMERAKCRPTRTVGGANARGGGYPFTLALHPTYWHPWDRPPKSPPLDEENSDDDLDLSARGRLAPILLGDVERTDPNNGPQGAATLSRSVPVQEAEGGGTRREPGATSPSDTYVAG